MEIQIDKPRSPEDWRAIRELCGRTAEEGRGIEAARWPFFSEFWVGPYEKLLPEWTYAAREGPIVIGYLTGCPDTPRFERKRLLLHRWPLFVKALLGFYPRNEDTRRFIRRFLGLEKTLESRFPRQDRLRLLSIYPAHLHVNVDAALRGRGVGQKLMGAFIEDLRKAGVPGAHLVCGERPVGFYKRLRFDVLIRVETPPAGVLYVMGRSL
ncbi:MAG: hypothetical protein HY922_01205 [Elusimicrobia bacterium]|nr:hypothetical protein [Elusimicrobiota bacterium]